MKKTLYSLMLSENVIAAVDALAVQYGTNRSNLVNQILADYVSYTTPEKRIDQIFSAMESLFSGRETFQVMLRNSASTLNMRSALDFKYNPNVRYSVELYRSGGSDFGELRVSMRTQNHSLLLYVMQFFKLWAKLECSRLPDCVLTIQDGRLIRQLSLRGATGISSQQLGQLLTDYISTFDRALKAFFYHLNDPNMAVMQVERIYLKYYNSSPVLI